VNRLYQTVGKLYNIGMCLISRGIELSACFLFFSWSFHWSLMFTYHTTNTHNFGIFDTIFVCFKKFSEERLPRELGWKHWQKTQIDTNNTVDEYSETGFFFCLNFLLLWSFRYRVAHARRSKLTAQRVPRNWTTERSALGLQVSRYCAKRVA